MNKQRLTPESNPALDNKPVAELLASLSKVQGYGKAQVIFALARKSHSLPGLMQVVLQEAASTDNQSTIAQFNDSVAMAAAFAVVDDGQSEDIETLKQIVKEWQSAYQEEDFYYSLKENGIIL